MGNGGILGMRAMGMYGRYGEMKRMVIEGDGDMRGWGYGG